MKDNVNLYHEDDVSIVSILNDIYDEKKMTGKTVKVVISCLYRLDRHQYKSDAMKLLREQYDYKKEYIKYGVKFILFDDFDKDDKYNDYKHYYYHWRIANTNGDFRVDYKILEDK